MAKIGTGKSVGKTASNYRDIKVGDTVKSIHTGLIFIVTNYGTLKGTYGDKADMVAELRRRGWEVKCTRTTIEEL